MKFSKKEAFKYGWAATKRHFWFFAVATALSLGLNSLTRVFRQEGLDQSVSTVIVIVVAGVALAILRKIVELGIIRASLKVVDGKKPKFSDLSVTIFRQIVSAIVADILYGAIMLVGLILLIVPGIIWGVKFQFFSYFIVDKQMGPIEALKASSRITQGVKWQLFLFDLLQGLILVAGVLALFVGLFVAMPVTSLASAHIYRKLGGGTK